MRESGSAFLKGGFGCLAAFLLVGFAAVLTGWSVRLDLGGAILLFLLGGVAGLAAWAIYHRANTD